MKQRISAIILLLSFIGVMAHDIIPHHHHDTEEASELHFDQHPNEHDHSACSHHSKSESEHQGEEFAEAHPHHCSHELHNCTLTFYDPGRALSQKAQRLIKVSFIVSEPATASQSGKHNTKNHFSDSRSKIYSNIYLCSSQLRGPPVLA